MGHTAIVIGATGVVGRALVDELAASPNVGEVVTVSRRPVVHPSSKVRSMVTDFEQLADHAAAFEGSHFYSALGTTRKQAGSVAAQRRVDVEYQLQAAQLALQGGVSHCLLVSSFGANATSFNAYSRMKGELEKAVIALGFERTTIFRPSLITGDRPDNRQLERAGEMVFSGISAIPGLKRFRPISGREVAAAMVRVSAETGPAVEYFELDRIHRAASLTSGAATLD